MPGALRARGPILNIWVTSLILDSTLCPRTVEPQDLDSCSQRQLDILYPYARLAFQNISGLEYFGKIKAFLGEAGAHMARWIFMCPLIQPGPYLARLPAVLTGRSPPLLSKCVR